MSQAHYTQEILKKVVAKICLTIGWHSIQSTSLEIMVDILRRYLQEISKLTHGYATLFGHTQPNLDELGLAFRDMHINIADLQEYVRYVDSGLPFEVPFYPVPKESHLNFLKPGSGEVVTRPVHIYEHLPPMYKISDDVEMTEQKKQEETTIQPTNTETTASGAVFKRPADISTNEASVKRPRLMMMEEEGRPTREISSVMMTTSGFLSPAREGKLPEARTPISAIDTATPSTSAANNTSNNVVANTEARFEKKIPKIVRDPKKIDKRKEKFNKELFKPIGDEIVTKKIGTMKDVVRFKALKANMAQNNSNMNLPNNAPVTKVNNPKSLSTNKQSKAQMKSTIKNEKHASAPVASVVTTKSQVLPEKVIEGKLSCEPDKLKLNIFKKISKVKDEKVEKTDKNKVKDDFIEQESRESSPDLIIDETELKNNWDPTKMTSNKQIVDVKQEPSKYLTPNDKVYDLVKNSPHSEKEFLYNDDMSPPGTPSTPKTPEMPTHSPPLKVEKESKRKRKDKQPKIKNKPAKMPRYLLSPRRNKNESFESELERPKTPNDPINLVIKDEQVLSIPPPIPPSVFQFFPGFLPGGPGLIPPPLANPLFPRLPLTGAGLPKHGFGQPAHIPSAMPALPFVPVPIPQLNQLPIPQPLVKQPQQPIVDRITIEKLPLVQPTHHDQPNKKHELNESPLVPTKEKHKKDKKDKPKKKNKKDKIKNKSEKRKLKEEKKEKEKIKKKDKKKDKEREQHEGSVPKLTLRIGSPRPPTPDVQLSRKIMIKPVVKKDEDQLPSTSANNTNSQEKREPSPELARISALITRPPKLKTSTKNVNDQFHSNPNEQNFIPTFHAKLKKNMFRAVPKIKSRDRKQRVSSDVEINDLQSSAPSQIDTPKNNEIVGPPAAFYIDNDGNKVWICPACGGQDDGSPMIGCDDCDAWYHWVCVGIQVPPDDNEDWYCRICIVKKQETIQMDKKKKRKKKERKEH